MLFLSTLMLAVTPSMGVAGETLCVASDCYGEFSPTEDTHRAAQLVDQAKQAAEAGRPDIALQLATAALRFDTNEPTARQALGYQRFEGQWLTAFQQKQVSRGLVWHPQFGWLKADEVPRYEAGERRDGRRWFSAQQDAARHATIANGWQVRTDHFQVTTNHSLEAAARLAAELEQLHQVWRQLFAAYYLDADEVRDLLTGKRGARVRSRPYNVIYHRDKASYVAALQHKQPRIGETLGIYFNDVREAHFFADPQADPVLLRSTLYHEAVHQLFQESQRTNRNVGRDHGYWAVEGVATYFESLTPAGAGEFVIGGADGGRLPAARQQAGKSRIMPLAELAALGMSDLQRRPDLPQVYSQMAGVATFLMHSSSESADPSRRAAFVRYLRGLYTGRAKREALWQELGESPSEAQAAYQAWLANP